MKILIFCGVLTFSLFSEDVVFAQYSKKKVRATDESPSDHNLIAYRMKCPSALNRVECEARIRDVSKDYSLKIHKLSPDGKKQSEPSFTVGFTGVATRTDKQFKNDLKIIEAALIKESFEVKEVDFHEAIGD